MCPGDSATKKGTKVVLWTRRSLFLFWKMIGAAPVTFLNDPRSGETTVKTSPICLAYSAVILIFIIVMKLEELRIALAFDNYPSDPTIVIAFFLNKASMVITVAISVLLSPSKCRKLCVVMKTLHNFDEVLLQEPHIISSKLTISIVVWLVYITVLVTAQRLTTSNISFKTEMFIFIEKLLEHYHEFSVILQLMEMAMAVKGRFRIINEKLNAIMLTSTSNKSLIHRRRGSSEASYFTESTDTDAYPVSIMLLRAQHQNLCQAVQSVNNVFRGQIFLAMSTLFMHSIMATYLTILKIMHHEKNYYCLETIEFVIRICWISAHLMGLLMIILPCASTTNQANQTSKIVSHLLNRGLTSEKRRQLKTFSMQLLHHDAKYSVYGLFDIDIPLILSVAGTTAMYLVILIQFRSSETEQS